MSPRRPSLLALALGLVAAAAEARVVGITIERREPVLAGQPFGLAGPYETLVGTVEFALDPSLRQNQAVVDLALAPRNERGEVVFTADFSILKPVDLRRGNGRVYYEVPNRGGKGILRRLQYAEASLDPREPADFGDGWLMEQGFSIAWMGWQWDVPERPGLLRLRAPIATSGGRPIEGLVRSVVLVGERKDEAPLGDSSHLAYPPVDPDGRDSRLYVRDHRLDPPRLLPRKSWRFVGTSKVALDGGFEPGRIYEVVYRSRDPRVAGCGFAATRDLVSFLKSEAGAQNPLAGVTLAVGHGISQSGRFLRHFLHQGFNEDEQGRRVFDGVFVEVAGAGRGSFNHRFAQASRDGHQHWNVHYPTDVFPFTDRPETDPETGETAGLLDRAIASGTVAEALPRGDVLRVLEPGGVPDAHRPGRRARRGAPRHEPRLPHRLGPARPRLAAPRRGRSERQRRAPPHEPQRLPPRDPRARPRARPVGRRGRRAAAEPVPADRRRHARPAGEGRLAPGPGRALPARAQRARADGLRPRVGAWRDRDRAAAPRPRLPRPRARGRRGRQRPRRHPPARGRGAARHADGLELAPPAVGAPDALVAYRGSYLPFAWTQAEREATRDPRLSVEERYRGREDYLGRVALAAVALVRERLLLPQDVPFVLERAAAHWDWRATSERSPAPLRARGLTALVLQEDRLVEAGEQPLVGERVVDRAHSQDLAVLAGHSRHEADAHARLRGLRRHVHVDLDRGELGPPAREEQRGAVGRDDGDPLQDAQAPVRLSASATP